MESASRPHPAPKGRLPPLADRVRQQLDGISWDVVLRRDFSDVAGYDQVGRALQRLVAVGILVRIGHGLYAKTAIGPMTGRTVPRKDMKEVAKQAMGRLGVEVGQTPWEREYAERRTSQMPLGNVVAVRSRVRREIGWGPARSSSKGLGDPAVGAAPTHLK